MKIYEKLKAMPGAHDRREITVAFLGDSVTQGCFELFRVGDSADTVHDYDSSFAYRFREIMNLLYPDVQVNAINAGISGDYAENGLKRIEKDVFQKNPDLLVISYGLNDSARGVGAETYAEEIAAMTRAAIKRGIDVIYLTQNFMNTTISPFVTDPVLRSWAEEYAAIQNGGVLERYYAAGKKAAAGAGAEIVDLYSAWEKLYGASCNVTELLANKMNHPIREYHIYVAIRLIEKIFGIR